MEVSELNCGRTHEERHQAILALNKAVYEAGKASLEANFMVDRTQLEKISEDWDECVRTFDPAASMQRVFTAEERGYDVDFSDDAQADQALNACTAWQDNDIRILRTMLEYGVSIPGSVVTLIICQRAGLPVSGDGGQTYTGPGTMVDFLGSGGSYNQASLLASMTAMARRMFIKLIGDVMEGGSDALEKFLDPLGFNEGGEQKPGSRDLTDEEKAMLLEARRMMLPQVIGYAMAGVDSVMRQAGFDDDQLPFPVGIRVKRG